MGEGEECDGAYAIYASGKKISCVELVAAVAFVVSGKTHENTRVRGHTKEVLEPQEDSKS